MALCFYKVIDGNIENSKTSELSGRISTNEFDYSSIFPLANLPLLRFRLIIDNNRQ